MGQDADRRTHQFYTAFVDYDFVDFFGLEVLQGRNFSKSFSSDVQRAYILNETAVRWIGWDNPVGKKFGWRMDGEIIGVIKDFHHASLHSPIGPMVLMLAEKDTDIDVNHLFIKVDSENMMETMNYIENKFREHAPGFPFAFTFLDDRIDRAYRSERKLVQNFNYFSAIAIFIACLGLFGLALFTAEKRTKEIGIRKVLGASVPGIFIQLSRGFCRWVVMANIIAWPIAYHFMNQWLNNFAYRIKLNIWIFTISVFAALAIAVLTVSYQTIKAARANPVEALRYE